MLLAVQKCVTRGSNGEIGVEDYNKGILFMVYIIFGYIFSILILRLLSFSIYCINVGTLLLSKEVLEFSYLYLFKTTAVETT